jgi:tRNA-specific 2-thiouridylase
VLVGMSGGVDSSVAAALLVEAGYDVCGAYMKNWILDVPGMRCPWADDLVDAKRTAVRLGIDFKVYDFQEAYKREVVDYLVEEYRAGRTPNPDVMCNQEVKFGIFLEAALAEGFDYIATGHYARSSVMVLAGETGGTRDGLGKAHAQLLRAADEHKDQTYFLYRMSQDAVDRTLFPLGDFTKSQVRAMADKRGLPSADKADSQGICFVGEAGIREFLGMYIQPQPGPTIDVDTGKTVGHHDGAVFFTIGQRKGLGIGGGTAPYYVVGKDMKRNEVYVSMNPAALQLRGGELKVSRLSWVSGEAPAPGAYLARIRHAGPLLRARVACSGETACLAFPEAHQAVAPGQSVVIYDGDVCLGGGIAV